MNEGAALETDEGLSQHQGGEQDNNDPNKKYKQAAEFNLLLLLQRQERGPFYYEPHTRSVQVLPSWIVRYNGQWASNRSPIVKLHEQHQQILQKHMQQQYMHQQQQRHADHVQQQQYMILQQQIFQQQLAQQQAQQQLQQQQIKEQQPQEIIVYNENGEIVPKPKPSITAFIHYSMMMREELKKQHPGMNITELSKVMGVKWRAMDEEEHKPYMDKAREDKRRYDREMEEYQRRMKLSQQNPQWAVRKAELADEQQHAYIVPSPASPQIIAPPPPPRKETRSSTKMQMNNANANAKCETCGGKQTAPGQLVTCSACHKNYHPPCIQLNLEAAENVKTRASWQCVDCKVCEVCHDPGNEDKLLICDSCDVGCHTFCVNPPLTRLPIGGWKCQDCVFCVHCGARTPGQGASCKWRANYTACDSCHQLYMDNKFCPVCERVYRFTDKSPMVECEGCNRWVHIQCDNIDDETYKQMSQDDVHYLCPVCRKEKPDPNLRPMHDVGLDARGGAAVANNKPGRRMSERAEKAKRRKYDDDFVDIED